MEMASQPNNQPHKEYFLNLYYIIFFVFVSVNFIYQLPTQK